MSIFARLNYDSNAVAGFVQPLSDAVQKQINTMPPLLNSWQQSDIANNNVGGYFQNPLANTLSTIITTANSIITIAGIQGANTNVVFQAANTLALTTGPGFLAHTNRISGVEPINTDTVTLPHYNTAISVGKMLQYLVSQSDGVQNNGPILSSFTSLFVGNTLNVMANTIQTDYQTLNTSIYTYTYYDPDLGQNVTVNQLNVSPSTANTIGANVANIVSLMTTRQNYDVTYYQNAQSVINDYNSVKQFNSMGQTETSLTGLVGSSKLTSRLNP